MNDSKNLEGTFKVDNFVSKKDIMDLLIEIKDDLATLRRLGTDCRYLAENCLTKTSGVLNVQDEMDYLNLQRLRGILSGSESPAISLGIPISDRRRKKRPEFPYRR